MRIIEFRKEYAFLSNMSSYPIYYDHILYSCVESAFHAMKTLDIKERYKISVMTGPEAKSYANNMRKEGRVRPDWKKVNIQIMRELLFCKFSQHESLKQKLLATNNIELIEESKYGDDFWGTVNGVGENNLGKLLMEVRTFFQCQKDISAFFTGHRPKDLFLFQKSSYHNLYSKIIEVCRVMITKYGVTTFISGGAQGVDQLAFYAVNYLKKEYPFIKNVIYVPFIGQHLSWKEEGLFSQNEYFTCLKCADKIYFVKEDFVWSKSGQYGNNDFVYYDESSNKIVFLKSGINRFNKNEVNNALLYRNQVMMEDSTYLIAVSKKTPNEINNDVYIRGGTANAIRKTVDNKKKIAYINPISLECDVLYDKFESLAMA